MVERVTMPIMVAAVAFTLASVVLGQFLTVAFAMNKEFGIFDLPLAWNIYTDIAFDEALSDLLFGLAGGAIGAFYALRMMKRTGAAPHPPSAGQPTGI
jgi:hypothetical protein